MQDNLRLPYIMARNLALAVTVLLQISPARADLYWDGPNTTANCRVDGGDGTWNFSTPNWTTADGCVQWSATPFETGYWFSNWNFSVSVPVGGLALPPGVTWHIGTTNGASALSWYQVVTNSFSGGPLTLTGPGTVEFFYTSTNLPGWSKLYMNVPLQGPGSLTVRQFVQSPGWPEFPEVWLTQSNSYAGGTTITGPFIDLLWASDSALGSGPIQILPCSFAPTLNRSSVHLQAVGGPRHLNQSLLLSTNVGCMLVTEDPAAPWHLNGLVQGTLAPAEGDFHRSTFFEVAPDWGDCTIYGNAVLSNLVLSVYGGGQYVLGHDGALGNHMAWLDWSNLTLPADRHIAAMDQKVVLGRHVRFQGPGSLTLDGVCWVQGTNDWSGWSDETQLIVSNSLVRLTGTLRANPDKNHPGFVSKEGPGTLELHGANTYYGGTRVVAGRLRVLNTSGSATGGSVQVDEAASLEGNGYCQGSLTNAGTLLVGYGTKRELTVSGPISFLPTGHLVVNLGGTTPGVDQDQLKTYAPLSLGGATLDITLNYAPAPDDVIFLIVNSAADPVTGEFGNWPVYCPRIVGTFNGVTYTARISYNGNANTGETFNGNDVCLFDFKPLTIDAQVFGGTNTTAPLACDADVSSGPWDLTTPNWYDSTRNLNFAFRPQGPADVRLGGAEITVTPAGMPLPTNAAVSALTALVQGGPLTLTGSNHFEARPKLFLGSRLQGSGAVFLQGNDLGNAVVLMTNNSFSGGTTLGNLQAHILTDQPFGTTRAVALEGTHRFISAAVIGHGVRTLDHDFFLQREAMLLLGAQGSMLDFHGNLLNFGPSSLTLRGNIVGGGTNIAAVDHGFVQHRGQTLGASWQLLYDAVLAVTNPAALGTLGLDFEGGGTLVAEGGPLVVPPQANPTIFNLGAGFGPGGDITLQTEVHLGLGNPGVTEHAVVVSNTAVTLAARVIETPGSNSRLVKRGPGTLRLESGDNNWLAGTRVEAGTLIAANGLSGGSATGYGPLEVLPGATLGGNGRIGGGTVIHGTLAPGESLGTLTFAGPLQMLAGSWLNVEITGPGNHDLIVAQGPVDLVGARLRLGGGYTPTPADRFFILQNDSGQPITGQLFGAPEGGYVNVGVLNGRGYAARVSYHGNHQVGDIWGGDDLVLYDFTDKIQGPQYWDGAGPAHNFVVNGGSGAWTTNTQAWTDALGSVNLLFNPDGDPNLWFKSPDGTIAVQPAGIKLPWNAQLHFDAPNYAFTGGPLELRGQVSVTNNAVFDTALTGDGSLWIGGPFAPLVTLERPNSFAGGTLLGNCGIAFATNHVLGEGMVTVGDRPHEAGLRGVLEFGGDSVLSNAFHLTQDWPLEIFSMIPNQTLTLAGAISGEAGASLPGPLLNIYADRVLVTGELTNTATIRLSGALALGRDQWLNSLTALSPASTLEAVGDSHMIVLNGGSLAFQEPDESPVSYTPRGIRVVGQTNLSIYGPTTLLNAGDGFPRQTHLDVRAPQLVIGGTVTGNANSTLVKRGGGRLMLAGNASGAWSTRIEDGTLLLAAGLGVDSLGRGALEVGAQGRLAGWGSATNTSTIINGAITPGDDLAGMIVLQNANSIEFRNDSSLGIDLYGPGAPNVWHDQLQAQTPLLRLFDSRLTVQLHYAPSFADKFFIVTGASQVAGFFRNRFPGQFTYVGAFGGQHFAARISYTGNAAAGLTTGGHDIVLHDFTVIPAPPTLEILPAAPGRFSFRWLSASGWNYQTRYALPGSFPTFYVIPGAISSGTGGYVTNTFPILQGPPDPDKNAGPWTNSPNVFFNVELVVP